MLSIQARRMMWSAVIFLLLLPRVSFAQSVRVVLSDGTISPIQITAQKGKKVDFQVVNQGSRRHNFVVPDFYLFTQNLNPGETVTASFTPDKAGTFPYYSDTGGKPEPGMRGTMTVKP